jgi:2-methylisocitrate lyase-like PEP mutase family enzyme
MSTQAEKFHAFTSLHQRPGAFVIPNPWNAGTARLLATLGFEALATTSAGLAFSIGQRDSAANLSRDVVLQNAAEIVAATDLPVSADLENGFGDSPEACALTIREGINVGLVGGSIEDCSGNDDDPIYTFDHAVERVVAAVEAAKGQPFVLTARTENYLHRRRDLNDTVKRLQAFSAAGADVLYAPGLPDLESIRVVCSEVDKPVNVVMGLQGTFFTVEQLAEVGVKRISVGGSLARAALGALVNAATEIRDQGTFTYANHGLSSAEALRLTAG